MAQLPGGAALLGEICREAVTLKHLPTKQHRTWGGPRGWRIEDGLATNAVATRSHPVFPLSAPGPPPAAPPPSSFRPDSQLNRPPRSARPGEPAAAVARGGRPGFVLHPARPATFQHLPAQWLPVNRSQQVPHTCSCMNPLTVSGHIYQCVAEAWEGGLQGPPIATARL